jgi:hypothetical protein
LAYIDEVGETGPFVSKSDPRFNTSPAFGYAGFIIDESNSGWFGSRFAEAKKTLFRTEIELSGHPNQWERKGADIFRPKTPELYPQQIRVFCSLVRALSESGGSLFYYADEKPIGTKRQTNLNTVERESREMRETLNRIARHAESRDRNVMVLIDQINEKSRAERLPAMYGHILGRAADHPEMHRVLEPPMHIDSLLSSGIQFADWVAACVGRAIDYQLIEESRYEWVTTPILSSVHGSFTHESKLHLWNRSVHDINHSGILSKIRLLFPPSRGQRIGSRVDPAQLRIIKAAAERQH